MTVGNEPHGGGYWLASYPKSGNTWVRILIDSLETGSSSANINHLHTTGQLPGWQLAARALGYPLRDLNPDELLSLRPALQRWAAANIPEARYHKTHEGNFFTPRGEALFDPQTALGVVYIVRNPLDIVASYSHHRGSDLDSTIAKMADTGAELASNPSANSPRMRLIMGSWSLNVSSWLDAPSWNRLLLRYEDLCADPLRQVTRLATFLKLDSSPQNVQKAVTACQFDSLAQQEDVGGFAEKSSRAERFFRRGRPGAWQEELSASQVAEVMAAHAPMMQRLGYLSASGSPLGGESQG